MKTLAPLVLLLIAAGPLRAQDRSAETQIQDSLKSAADRAAIEKALAAMTAAGPAGKAAAAKLRSSFSDIRPAKQDDAWRVEQGPRMIRYLDLSDSLSRDAKDLGPILAEAAEREETSSMPESAEKEYMVRATAARVAVELGGAVKAVASVDEISNGEHRPRLTTMLEYEKSAAACYDCKPEYRFMAADRARGLEDAVERYRAFLAGTPR